MIARDGHVSVKDRRRLGRHGRNAVPGSAAGRSRSTAGATLHPIRIAYETYGTLSPARDNVILVCHALSGDAHAAGFAKTPPPESTRDGFGAEDRDGTGGKGLGWWDGMIGPGKAFDTDRFFVVSHQPARRLPRNDRAVVRRIRRPAGRTDRTFPVITVADMVRTERAFLDELGIERLAAVAGGSLGGMQAFEWAILYPDQVDAIVAIASTHALQPQGVAWNAIARNAIMADPDWQGGHYYGTGRKPDARHGRRADGRPHHVPVGASRSATSSRGGCSSPTTSATR